jgi:hypothetical protein
MRNRSKLLFGALTAALIFGAAVSASANRLANSSDTFRTTFASLEFVGANFFTIRCPVTLEGRYHSRTISKVNEALIGYVTSAFVRNESCTGGHATILGESLPWHVRYASFEGTLPGIRTITQRIIGARFQVEFFGSHCVSTTTAASPGIATITREPSGVVTSVAASGTVPTTPGEGGSCPTSTGTLRGTGTPTDQAGARVSVTLVA